MTTLFEVGHRALIVAYCTAALTVLSSAFHAHALAAVDDADGDGIEGSREPGDTDGDGIVDKDDPDDDNDGLLTVFECGSPLDPVDSDGDELPDHKDPDDDNDGVLTQNEHPDDDGDGDPSDARSTANAAPDYLNTDDDDDGVSTFDERPDFHDRDTDGDTRPDHLDGDDDNDGLAHEGAGDSDNDGLPDNRDPDDDNDQVPTLLELVLLIDTDGDGLPDPIDPDDDGDGMPTQRELGAGGATHARDSDLDGIADYLDADDDGDGVLSKNEDSVDNADHDGDGTPDYLDTDDDGDGIPTRAERGWTPDPDRDGLVSWLDLDADGDGVSDANEGTGDLNGNGIADFLDAATPGVLDAGVPVDAGAGMGDTGVVDASSVLDASSPGVTTTGKPADDGCSVAPRAPSRWSLGLSSLLLALTALVFRRGARTLCVAAGLTVAAASGQGCGDDGDGQVVDFFDGGQGPSIDAALEAGLDAGLVDATAPDSALANTECIIESTLFEQRIDESSERGWVALKRDNTVHFAYVVPTCAAVGSASGTRIDYRNLRSSGAVSDATALTSAATDQCRVVGAPALAPNAAGALSLYYTGALDGSLALLAQDVALAAGPTRVNDDGASRAEILRTVATTYGEGPMLAYVKRESLIAPAQLVTRRPGVAESEIVGLTLMHDPTSLSLLAGSGDFGGALGWVSERSTALGIFVQVLDAKGAAKGAAVKLSDVVGGLSSIALAGTAGHTAVVYTLETASVPELRYRTIDVDGTVSTREVKLTSANRSASSPSIAPYASGYVVAFRDVPERTEVPAALRLSFLAENGMVGGERRLADVSRTGGETQIFVMNDGRLIVLWSDSDEAGTVLRAVRARCL